MTTLFSINNASAVAVLANVVVWTDLGVPTLGFQVYLTGYDVQTINLRDIFHGNLPRTASDRQDPQDAISPQGDYSQDLNFASCSGTLPYQPLPASFVSPPARTPTPGGSRVCSAAAPARTSGTAGSAATSRWTRSATAP